MNARYRSRLRANLVRYKKRKQREELKTIPCRILRISFGSWPDPTIPSLILDGSTQGRPIRKFASNRDPVADDSRLGVSDSGEFIGTATIHMDM